MIRDLDSTLTTAPMDCEKAMAIARSGKWATNWSLEAVLENPAGSAPILKRLMAFKEGNVIDHRVTAAEEANKTLLEQTRFLLNDLDFDAFEKAVNAPSKNILALDNLMKSKPVWE